jgi:peptidoglycan/LPS O-acetylase OafA/YrhL
MALIASHRLKLRRVALATALGALTYPLYLLHNRIGKLIFVAIEPSVSPLIGVLLIGTLSFGLSWLMAEYVERRGLRWVNRTPLVQQLMA